MDKILKTCRQNLNDEKGKMSSMYLIIYSLHFMVYSSLLELSINHKVDAGNPVVEQ